MNYYILTDIYTKGLYLTILRNEKNGEFVKFKDYKLADNCLRNIKRSGVKAFIHKTNAELKN